MNSITQKAYTELGVKKEGAIDALSGGLAINE
jgi:hypothetical protein